ncbi:MAG: DUF1365 family protein, partial [Pseudohongiellaceae bacterium]
LERLPVSSANLRNILWQFPFMTMKTGAAIYWQALKLWLKRVPFIANPRSTINDNLEESGLENHNIR